MNRRASIDAMQRSGPTRARAHGGSDVSRLALRGSSLALLLAAAIAPRVLLPPLVALAFAAALLSFIPRGTRRTVLAAMVGMATSQGAIFLFTTGIFQAPMTAEFGWTRTEYFVITPISVFGAMLTVPLIGTALDRYGVRRVVLPSVVVLIVFLVAYTTLSARLWHLYLLAFLFAVLASGTGSGAYARLMTLWFERRRGLALGAVLAGVGIGGATLAPLVQWCVDRAGWRGGFLALAGLVLCAALPVLVAWLRDSPAERGLGADGEPLATDPGAAATAAAAAAAAGATGLDVSQALRSPVFRRLAITFAVLGFAVGGLFFQLFPILTSLGVAASAAAALLGSSGIALIAGRACGGFLMDRFFAPRVAVAFLLGPLAGCIALALGVSGTPALLAALAIGLAAGAEIDVLAYLTARYFGTRAYARLYMSLYVAWSVGSGLGPVLAARISDTTGSYAGALWVYAAVFGVASALLLSLGPFPQWPAARPVVTAPAT